MKSGRRAIGFVICIILGIVLLVLGSTETGDPFWSGMGTALLCIGILRLVKLYRFHKDENYRQEAEIEAKDERNQFIRSTALAWASYLFVIIAGIATIILKVMGQDLLSLAASLAGVLLMLLYAGAYLFLQRKY